MPPIHHYSFRSLRTVVIAGLMLTALAPVQAQTAAPPYAFSHLAGPLGGYGNADGTGAAARFRNPNGMAVDGAGNVYVADTWNHTIRRITAAGVVTTLAGTAGSYGSTDGTGNAARFYDPAGVAVDGAGNVYVADTSNNTIRKITAAGVVTTIAGTAGDSIFGGTDGVGPAAWFDGPRGLAVDSAGTLYVADSFDNTIRKITSAGVVTTIAGTPPDYNNANGYGVTRRLDHPGSADGIGTAAQFRYPAAVAVDSVGDVYVADEGNNTIRRIAPTGVVTTLAGTAGQTGSADGTGAGAQFYSPCGVAMDTAGNVYVADTGNGTIRKITPGGVVTTLAGTAGAFGSADGTGAAARFWGPEGLAVDGAGNVYVGDGDPVVLSGDHAGTIRKITPGGVVTTLAGQAGARGSVDGTATAARFNSPQSVAVDTAGNVYVADALNSTIRKITSAGVVTTFAGTAGQTGSADGTGAAALFNRPTGVAADLAGNIYVADHDNSTLRKITPAGVVTTLAGTAGQFGSADGTGAAAQFHNPVGLAVDRAGNVYVSDGDYFPHTMAGDPEEGWGTIRKVTPSGVVTTLAGNPIPHDTYDPSPYERGAFDFPKGVAVDESGTVYVADGHIRKITPEGAVTTLWDLVDETGAATQFLSATGVAVDQAGNLYVTDNYLYATANYLSILRSTLRKITPAGVVTTLAGTAGVLGSADGIGPAAQFNGPSGLAMDSAGNLYVADSGNNAIRKGQLAGPPMITSQPQSQKVVAGGSVQFTVTAGGVPAPTYQWYFNGSPFSGATTNTLSFANARATDAGDYTVVATNELGSVTSRAATLTVNAVNPPPSGGGGGGGALEAWFVVGLVSLGMAREIAQRRCEVSG